MLTTYMAVAVTVLLAAHLVAGWRVGRTAQLMRRRGIPIRLFESQQPEPRTDYSFGKGLRKAQDDQDSPATDSSRMGTTEPVQGVFGEAPLKVIEDPEKPLLEKPKSEAAESEGDPFIVSETMVEFSAAEVIDSKVVASESSDSHQPPASSTASTEHDKNFSIDSFAGIMVERVSDGVKLDLGAHLASLDKALVVFGTYAADFNCIEYAQRVRHYLPSLKEKGVTRVVMIINGAPSAAKKLAELVGLQAEVELLSDPLGSAGRAFGVSRGWIPEEEISPYLKLFGMLWGLGAWATLPSVIGGYIGNPWGKQPWIQSALLQGQLAGRWPNNALVLDENGAIKENKFDSLKYVGGWGRRPLELATLRLQNMIGISLRSWADLKPSDDSLAAGVLTQLGGCVLITKGEKVPYIWRDQGICHVANFETILKKI